MKQNNYCTMPAILLLAIISIFTFLPQQSDAQSIVISQVYGGGGNSGATYTNDFIELFNSGTTAQSLSGWSVQYASATGTTWAVTSLSNVTLQPGQYYLIQQAAGAGGTASLPTPDVIGTIPMAAGAGKVALVNTTTALTGSCPSGSQIIDFVGFGSTANCFEGSGPTPAPSNTNAVIRANSGCTDTNNNSADFSAGTPTPRNTASTLNPCSVTCVAPVITCPGNINVSNAAGQCGINLPFMATATGTSPTITYSHAQGSFFPVGTTTVTATATNACGTDQCTFTVTVNDTEPPVASCQNVTVSLDANGVAVLTPAMVDNNSSDNCPGNLTYTLSRTNFSCSDIGAGTTINATDLFISEYIEGSSNNKCLEIFNGTGSAVDLAAGGYQIKVYANGAVSPTSTTSLSGVIANGDVFVICNTSAAIGFTSLADQLSGNMSFNGNDAVELLKSSTNQTLDIIGTIGEVPTTEWGTGLVSTADNTLRRKSSVTSGNTINGSGFPTLSTEWDGYPTDNADNLGSHIYSPTGSGIPVTLTVTDAAGNSSTCTAEITVIDDLAPVANCQNLTVFLDANGVASITAQDVSLNSSDNCSSVSLVIDRTTFDCNDIPVPASSTNDLIISEYVEGGGFNKYIEIFNGTGATVDLSNYELRLYSNGASTVSQSMNLGVAGSLASGATVVFGHGSATAYTGTTFVNTSVLNFNGDDAVELFNLSTNQPADIFGEIGVDPGTEWSVSGNSTADNTLRRELSVTSGNTTNTAGFPTLGTEWNVFPLDDVSGLGFHGTAPNAITVTLTVTDATGNSSTCTSTVTVADNIPPTITCLPDVSFCDGETVVMGNATATDNCGSVTVTNNAPANFGPGVHTITWTATDAAGNSTTCTQTVSLHYLNAIATSDDVLCYGENTGSITLSPFTNPAANPADILYSIDGGVTTQTSNVFEDLYAGGYIITVINTNSNCTTNVVATIDGPAAALTVTTSSTNTCAGGNTGTLSATPSGGTSGYTIEWYDANNVKVNNETAVGAGNYTVVVTDANGCTATGTVTVSENTGFTVSLGDDKVVFYGAMGFNGCNTLTANTTGATAPLSYNWTSNQPGFTSVNSNTVNACVTTDIMHTYTVVVTDVNGCTVSASVNVIYTNIDCSSQQNAGKVTICRVPPGNPVNCQTICVAVSAAQALINTGSYVGPCLPNCAIPQARANSSAPILSNDVELNVYPNPTSGNVHIEYRSETDNAELIVITDLQGRTVKTQDIKGAFEFHGIIDISEFDNGIYFINITGNNSVIKTTKVVKAE